MNKLDHRLIKIRKSSAPIGTMFHAVLGYPTLDDSLRLVRGMIDDGVDIIELQLPFSDPAADGPAIMNANDVAMRQSVTTYQLLEALSSIARTTDTPIIAMTYYQIVFAHGVHDFVSHLANAGVSGLIVPDLPPEEDEIDKVSATCKKMNISFVPVISPNSSDTRILQNIARAESMVYCTARQGITGQETTIDSSTSKFIERVQSHTDLPSALGFGISSPTHIKSLHNVADVAIVGSAIVNALDTSGVDGALMLVQELVEAAHHV